MIEFHLLRNPSPICAKMALGKSRLGFGNSSAMWVTASGVPIVKAPFNTPVKNATPPDQPVLLLKSVQTKWVDECWAGMAASTMIVTMPPTRTTKRPKC